MVPKSSMSHKEQSPGISRNQKTKSPREFDEGRLWSLRDNDALLLGMTAQAIEELGEIDEVILPHEGESFEKGDTIAEIVGSEGTLSLYSPLAGVVSETNTSVEQSPQSISKDPTGEGWLVRLDLEEGEGESEEEDE